MSGLLCAEAIARKGISEADLKEYPADYNSSSEIYDRFAPEIKEVAAKTLGIYRSGQTLSNAKETLDEILDSEEIAKDTLTIQIAKSVDLMVYSALNRKESRGAHMRLDYPEESVEYEKELII